jgi:hypothetical protein
VFPFTIYDFAIFFGQNDLIHVLDKNNDKLMGWWIGVGAQLASAYVS